MDFTAVQKGNAWILNGPSTDATNEKDSNNVNVKHLEFQINDNKIEFTFEPHSLTAVELERN
jgi:alpha-L-arabinofuranosidase